jgi:ABC-2 type transport system ATP-binding protein
MDEAERCGRVGYLYNSHLLTVGTPEELKTLPAVTPPRTRRLEITGHIPTELLAWLSGTTGVREATIFGAAIHALVDDDFSTDRLIRHGLSVRTTGANLEDVFVTLSRAQNPALEFPGRARAC